MNKMKIREIKNFVEEESNINLSTRTNKQSTVFIRWFYFYLCYKYTDEFITLQKIADEVNLKKHSTVLHGLKELEYLIRFDKEQSHNLKILEDKFIKKFNISEREKHEGVDNDIVSLRRKYYNSKNSLIAKREKYNALKETNRKLKLRNKTLEKRLKKWQKVKIK